MDKAATFFILAFAALFLFAIFYDLAPARRRSVPPMVRIVTRGQIRVKVVPLAYRPPERIPDDFYQGCYESLLRALDKEVH